LGPSGCCGASSRARSLQPKISGPELSQQQRVRSSVLVFVPSHTCISLYIRYYGEPLRRSKDRRHLGPGALRGALLQQVHHVRPTSGEHALTIPAQLQPPWSVNRLCTLRNILMPDPRHPRGDAGTSTPHWLSSDDPAGLYTDERRKMRCAPRATATPSTRTGTCSRTRSSSTSDAAPPSSACAAAPPSTQHASTR
jgi:hypothetical protein